MKIRNIIISLLTLMAVQNVFAGAAIDFGNATLIKRLKTSFDSAIDLYQTNHGAGFAHDDKFFTARTILRAGPTIEAYEQKALRNEVCASYKIYSAAPNQGLAIKWMPGSMGVYLLNGRVVSVADHGLMGERLDSVLRKLADENDAVKIFAARYYAVAMTKNLEIIHRAGIVWNNAHLRNFYVRPEGTLYAVDFSEAEMPAVPDLAARQGNEWKDFVVNTVQQMYSILFPAATANAQYLALVDATGAHTATWRTDPWTLNLFIAELNHILANGIDNDAGVPMAGGLSNAGTGAPGVGNGVGGYANVNNARDFLERANNIPYQPNFGLNNNIDRGDHDSAQNNNGNAAFLGNHGFALADAVRLITDSGNGTPFSRLDGALQAGDVTSMCLNWTGR